jgi:hypothetical protein
MNRPHGETSGHQVPLRPPSQVMRLARMGAFHASRLSFMRVLLRRIKREGWRFDRPVWRIDAEGVGVATYRAIGPERTYTLVAFAHDLPDDKRSDRVIAEAWDATFTLFDGEPTQSDIDRLSRNVPLQEAGRVSERELVLARANRSVRLFGHVIDCLAAGRQPDRAQVESVGYLMRTTAVYGSGKFGAADREIWSDRPEFRGSFQPELLAVWLIRSFTMDIVEHLAEVRARNLGNDVAARIDPALRRRFGVGNSTGLGMAPYLVSHPALIHAWIAARETALARVRALPTVSAEALARFVHLLERARENAQTWTSAHPIQATKIEGLRADLSALAERVAGSALSGNQPWDQLYRWAEAKLSLEGQEQLVSLMLEPYPELVDDLAESMSADEQAEFPIDGSMTLNHLGEILADVYGWALETDFAAHEPRARVWYVSEEKLEPRLGERFEEPIEPYEQPLAPGRDAALLWTAMSGWDVAKTVAEFLLRHPEHRHIIRRAQAAERNAYAEIRDNTIADTMLPIDLLRCKLSFFGATRFDPRSDRWVRITMYQDAPLPHELAEYDPDAWIYPPLRTAS